MGSTKAFYILSCWRKQLQQIQLQQQQQSNNLYTMYIYYAMQSESVGHTIRLKILIKMNCRFLCCLSSTLFCHPSHAFRSWFMTYILSALHEHVLYSRAKNNTNDREKSFIFVKKSGKFHATSIVYYHWPLNIDSHFFFFIFIFLFHNYFIKLFIVHNNNLLYMCNTTWPRLSTHN